MLTAKRLLQTPEVAVGDVRCTAGCDGWSELEYAAGHTLVFVRSGCFYRRVNGVETLVDVAVAYLRAPGEEQQIAHPIEGGDACTAIHLGGVAFASVWGGEIESRPLLVFTTAPIDLAHRRLLSAFRQNADRFELEERVWTLVASALEQAAPARVDSGRPASAWMRRKIVNEAREQLTLEPSVTLSTLARKLAVSPHHLSRIFHSHTGETLSRYRNRIRVRHALERLADGESSLTRLAAELGFSDHAHLTRVVRSETGAAPSSLRIDLAAGR